MERKKDDILNSGLLEQYVLGLLDKEEIEEVESILEEHPELWDYVRDLRVTLTAVSFQNGVRPASGGSQVEDVAEQQAIAARGSISSKWISLHWFSWVLLLALAGLNIYLAVKYEQLFDRYSQLEHRYSSVSTKVSHLKTEHSVNEFLVHENTRKQLISGTHEGQTYSSWVHINDHKRKAYWQMGTLPELQYGHYFKIWANVNGEMIPVGPAIRHHHDMIELEYHPKAESFHITMESSNTREHPDTDHLIASGPSGIKL